MNGKRVNKFAKLSIAVAGLIFCAAGFFLLKTNNDYIDSAIKTECIIEKIVDEHVTVSLIVGGKKVETSFNKYISTMQIGDKVTCYYKVDELSLVRSEKSPLDYLFIFTGFILVVIGVVTTITKNLKYKKLMNLTTSGIMIKAKINSIEMDNTIANNGVNPYCIYCTGVNPISGREEVYKSDRIWSDVRKIIEEKKIDSLPVYFENGNPDNYSMDIRELGVK